MKWSRHLCLIQTLRNSLADNSVIKVQREKGFEDVKVVIEALKCKGVSAIGAVGFCWGARVVAELAKGDFIQAVVMAHPSFVTLDDIKAVKVLICILGAEIDWMSPPEVVKLFEEALNTKSEIPAMLILGQ